jgi:hypothetical protein
VLLSLPTNDDVLAQALDFMEAHYDVLSTILKEAAASNPSQFVLEEAALITGLFYCTARSLSLMQEKLKQSTLRFHHLLMRLLVARCPSSDPSATSSMSTSTADGSPAVDPDLDICRNIIAYCRIHVENFFFAHSSRRSVSGATISVLPPVLFVPSFLSPDKAGLCSCCS